MKLLVDSGGARSPMEKVEPVFLNFVLWKQEARQRIPSSREGIELTTSLINHTQIEMEVQALQKSRHGNDTWYLTNAYWQGSNCLLEIPSCTLLFLQLRS
jgi:hypothetical protein